MKVWHPWQLKKSKSWEPFWSYQLNSTANSVHFAWFLVKWTKFKCRIFILCKIHCYICPPKSWHKNSFLGSVNKIWEQNHVDSSFLSNIIFYRTYHVKQLVQKSSSFEKKKWLNSQNVLFWTQKKSVPKPKTTTVKNHNL